MPQLIEDIDAIARRKQRDVLYISFDPSELTASKGPMEILEEEEDETRPSWRKLEVRRTVIQWLDGQGMAWQPLGVSEFLCKRFGLQLTEMLSPN